MIHTPASSLSAAERLASHFSGAHVPIPDSEPLAVYADHTACRCEFNVMSGRPVRETFSCREYRVWQEHIEGIFDRDYESAMEQSPQHVVFLTALAHAQKLAYIWASHHLGFGYDPGRPEQLKMWWNAAAVVMPSLEQTTDSARQWMHIDQFRQVRPNEYLIRVHTGIGKGVALAGRAPLYVIEDNRPTGELAEDAAASA